MARPALDVELAAALRRRGWRWKQIAFLLGVSRETCQRRARCWAKDHIFVLASTPPAGVISGPMQPPLAFLLLPADGGRATLLGA